jgi:predicted Zn finger-like uncharacterized protein
MIIKCVNCNKKFNVNSDLIPENGRLIQCGSCNHSWNFKKEVILEDQISNNQINSDPGLKRSNFTVSKKIYNFFSYLLIFIISLAALLIFVDTLKSPLINLFPGLEIVLFNLFETLKDIGLFIIDLT